MHAFIILNFLDKINAFNHEKSPLSNVKMHIYFSNAMFVWTSKIQITFFQKLERAIDEIWSRRHD